MSNSVEARIRRMVALATPLWERSTCASSESSVASASATSYRRRWADVLGSDGRLRRRLESEEYRLADFERLFVEPALAATQPLPTWASYIAQLLRKSDLGAGRRREGFCPPARSAGHEIPFSDLLVPLVELGREELSKRSGQGLELLGPSARRELEEQLLQRLCLLAALPLGHCFQAFKAGREPLTFLLPEIAEGSSLLYRSFVSEMLEDDGLASLFEQYPVLARLLGLTVEQWVGNIVLFCQRLAEDLDLIRRVFGWSEETGALAGVRVDLADRHLGGQAVAQVTFTSGRSLIYKPRSLSAEAGFYQLVDWLNRRGLSPPLKVPLIVDRSSHGWCEPVEHLPCSDMCEVELYYSRSGMLLALLYALRATDIHCENLIASGEHPVVIDLETILQSEPVSWALQQNREGRAAVQWSLRDSVLWTGLLPLWQDGPSGHPFDWSGLCAEAQQSFGAKRPVWNNVNTDSMDIAYEEAVAGHELNSVLVRGRVQSARDYSQELCAGFERMYRFLVEHRQRLLAAGGPIDRLRDVKLRTVIRDTSIYASLQSRLLHPEFLRDGADRSLELEALARPLGQRHDDKLGAFYRALYRSERTAMERLDVPVFFSRGSSTSLEDDDGVLASGYFRESGHESVRGRLVRFCEEDLHRQLGKIQLSLHARYWKPEVHAPPDTSEEVHGVSADSTLFRQEDALRSAHHIAETLQASSVRGSDGSVGWLGLRYDIPNETFRIKPMSYDLYGGLCGVALFLAALARLRDDHRSYFDLCAGALHDVRSLFGEATREPELGQYELGAATGLGGLIYSLVLMSTWGVAEGLLQDARGVAKLFTPERIAQDRSFGLAAGAGGGILGLLTLARATNDEGALAGAVACGDYLLRSRVDTDAGHRAWRPFWADRALLGFGHGAAGIAYALLRLAETSGEARFQETALEALEYEAEMFDAEAADWPDLRRLSRNGSDAAFTTAWCHGAPGIGLGRLASLCLSKETSQSRSELERSLAVTRAFPMSGPDHLCCGNLGRVELLLEAGRRLERPDLLAEARRRAAWVMARANRSARYSLNAQVPGVYSCPSFFQGLAGIGYSLLRLAAPESLPCVLIWE